MKRKYEKPMVLFEDFSMSTNIAGDCKRIVTSSVENDCVDETLVIPGPFPQVIFLSTVEGCVFDVEDGYNGFCYHNPTDSNNLFNS